MRFTKIVTSLFITIFFVVSLTACGSSMVKPSGLEEDTENQLAIVDEQTVVENENSKEISETDTSSASAPVEEEDSEVTDTVQGKEQDSSTRDEIATNENSSKSTTNETQVNSNEVNKSLKSNPEKNLQPEKEKDTQQSKANNKAKENKNTNPKEESTPEAKEEPKEETPTNTLVYSIVISDTEVPLPPTEMEVFEGDTVLDVLIRITQRKKIQMDYRGGQGATAYVEGIDNVYEFDRGQGSGWMYRVNGIFPDRGAGIVPLLPGDRVEWLYTTNLGEDLGADLQPFRR